MEMLRQLKMNFNFNLTSHKWLRIYIGYLSEVFKWILLGIALVVGAFTPLVPAIWLLVRLGQLPPKPVHNGWWIFAADIVFGIFWYTGAVAIFKNAN